MKQILNLSKLPHVWILDLDGTLLKHNKYKEGQDEWLNGALEFCLSIPETDYIIILTGRDIKYKAQTINFLNQYSVRFNDIIFSVPLGERILINDTKPSGLICAHSIPLPRDTGLNHLEIRINDEL